MTDEKPEESNKVAETIKAVEGVFKSVPVYQDALQPAAKELGKSLEIVAKVVNVVLEPISGLVWGYDQIKKFIITNVPQKLSGIPKENIISPKPEIAGPIIESLRFSGYNEDLRDLYTNLLATSMDKETATNAHPGFVEIIKNLAPDEARILRLFILSEEGQFPLVDLESTRTNDWHEFKVFIKNHSLLGKKAGVEHPNLVRSYIDNLCRLRLLIILEGAFLIDEKVYKEIEEDGEFKEIIKFIKEEGDVPNFKHKILEITTWGEQFCEACVRDKTPPTQNE